MNIRKVARVIASIFLILLVISFIIPYNPNTLYGTTSNSDTTSDITFTKIIPHKSLNDIENAQTTKKQEHSASEVKGNKVESDVLPQKMFVILVTGFRTGSTFLGELFNQNPDVLYLFEPFHQQNIKNLAEKSRIKGKLELSLLHVECYKSFCFF